MKPTLEIRSFVSQTVWEALRNSLMYEPNVKATWMRAEAAIDYALSKYSNYIAFHRITVDGTFYGDDIAADCASFEEYRVKYAAVHGREPADMSEREFAVRRYVKSSDQVYVKVEVLWDGHSRYDVLTDGVY